MRASFQEFLSDWGKSAFARITPEDIDANLDRLVFQLVELALRSGHRVELAKASAPYRSLGEFIKARYDATSHGCDRL